ncbi:hypothetical protein TEA_011115 [Camellia sinensis var. sinensis]|uniref:Uncharacterized protein n=1 Tax=Camellia sinensis var. sinensis TaxID=542762 RepID=A0A4V3WNG1_CAMSN|nr:hypothetical protein TEA_011115 [Camellia sinensis var. sinensis]
MLRKTKNYQNNYAPRVVSVGPYHHDHNNLKLQRMQELKPRITSKLVSDDQQLLEDLHKQLSQKVKQLIDCYEEKSTNEYNDDEFIRMMLVDGCFILIYAQGYTMKMIDMFIADSIMAPNVGKNVEELCPLHLLDVLHKRLVGCKHVELCVSNRYTFRNVEELIDMGIHVKKNKKSSCLTDINFSSFCNFGRLELPTITVDDSTKAKFLNLIAYEMCGDTPNNLWVTSYICFLDSLIDNPNDVTELRSANILQNCLGSDVEVATLFNKIGKDLVPHPCAYESVKKEIQSHYDNRGKAFIAQFKHRYFKSPWSFLALLGALLALVLVAFKLATKFGLKEANVIVFASISKSLGTYEVSSFLVVQGDQQRILFVSASILHY